MSLLTQASEFAEVSQAAPMGATPTSEGVLFRVWAPHADSVSVVGAFNRWTPRRHPMQAEGDGVWSLEIPGLKPGDPYRYWLETPYGGLSRMDPYARAVSAVKGDCLVYDPHRFDWEGDAFTPPPLNQLAIYEMHIGSFNKAGKLEPGTFDEVLGRLDYLAALGVNAIEVMPIIEFSGDLPWGYNPVHLFAVRQAYGGPDAFKRFVKQLHRRDIAVLLDVVYNHLGPEDLDLWRFDGWYEGEGGGIYFYNDWRAETLFGPRPDFSRPEVRRFILDNLRMWLDEYHVDGFRVDSVLYMRNVKGDQGGELPEAWSLLQEMTELVHRGYPGHIMVAEDLQGDARIVQPVAEGGLGFDTQWNKAFVETIRTELTKDDDERDVGAMVDVLVQADGGGFERVIYSESHDEDGEANGKVRVPELVGHSRAADWQAQKRSTLAAAMLFTIPGVPMLFQGQEMLEGDSFRGDLPLNWHKQAKFSGIVCLYTDLMHLRLNRSGVTPGLCGDRIDLYHRDDANHLLAYRRWAEGGEDVPGQEVVVVVNLSKRYQDAYRLGFPRAGRWRLRLNSDAQTYSDDFGNHLSGDVEAHPLAEGQGGQAGMPAGDVTVGPYTVLIYSQDA